MLRFYRIDISKGIDFNKTSASKECDIRHYWYFLYFNQMPAIDAMIY